MASAPSKDTLRPSTYTLRPSTHTLRPSTNTDGATMEQALRPSTDTPPPSTDSMIQVYLEQADIGQVNRSGRPWISPISWTTLSVVLSVVFRWSVVSLVGNAMFFINACRTAEKPKFKA
ncbi:uncharacterized protein BDZ99DRAFT_460889 [Mytilinidion resinicola]|uniref:Uncharacterized protein n=1 Tax=Mytilinidion resinicola TaxID=574789 RepID=A0A6A6YU86_9PEZI|nr:uncharacterized protein BDZ99DRAFT_460889 [Mytilinidion resinicola]KAF2812108.1 hypothetical protein BDZ99DRAFT_460889 [Mytilinidion resinicola]